MNKYNYTKISPFKCFVLENFPFIEDDFDALTNWQLFCKIGKEINKIINSQNELGEEMENVVNAFINLQNYVTNYFENLDVQDEIDNKLDRMVEAGTLQEIIIQYLSMKALLGFQNVSEMKNASNLINGTVCKTLGYYSANDGGSGIYRIRSKTLQDIEDNGSIHFLNNHLVAELIVENDIVTPEQFGAVGDGINDDTQALSNTFNFKRNIKLNKKYLCSSSLNLYANLIGKGTLLHNDDYVNLNLKKDDIIINGITIDAQNHTTIAIKAENINNITIVNCKVINVGNDNSLSGTGGIYYNNVDGIEIKNNIIDYCHCSSAYASYGISIVGNSQNIFIENNKISDIFPATDADGIKIMTQQYCNAYILNNKFYNCAKRCIKMKSLGIVSENNTFMYEDINIGSGPIEFQRGDNVSRNDKMIITINNINIQIPIYKVFGVCGDNVIIDGFSMDLRTPENYNFNSNTTYPASAFVRIEKNIDEGSSETANNIVIKNINFPKGLTRYFIAVVQNSMNSINNLKVENIEFEYSYPEATYYAINFFDATTANKCNQIEISNFKNKNNFDSNYTLFNTNISRNANTNFILDKIINIMPFLNYRSSKDYINCIIDDEGKLKGISQNKSVLNFIYNSTTNPSENTTSQYSFARNCPVGTKFIMTEPIYSNNKIQLGYICIIAGDLSKVGTCIPFYEYIE